MQASPSDAVLVVLLAYTTCHVEGEKCCKAPEPFLVRLGALAYAPGSPFRRLLCYITCCRSNELTIKPKLLVMHLVLSSDGQ